MDSQEIEIDLKPGETVWVGPVRLHCRSVRGNRVKIGAHQPPLVAKRGKRARQGDPTPPVSPAPAVTPKTTIETIDKGCTTG